MIFSMSHWSLTQLYLVTGRNISMRSGTLRMILKAQRAAFFRMYALEDLSSFSTSGAKSRAISTDAIEPSVQSAKPTTNWVVLFRSFFKQFVIKRWTSCRSSRRSMAARYLGSKLPEFQICIWQFILK